MKKTNPMKTLTTSILKPTRLVLLFVLFFNHLCIVAQTAVAPPGTGSQCDPYLIGNLNHLYWVTQNSSSWASGKYFVQTADIDASATSTWFPKGGGQYYGLPTIGGYSQSVGNLQGGQFNANYDGRGFSIDNLYINRSPHYVALFGSCWGATIKNMVLNNPTIIVGLNGGSISDGYQGNAILMASGSGTFDNNHIYNGTLTSNTWHGYVGGMFGRTGTIIVSNSSVNATINHSSTYGGNLGGFVAYSEFSNSVFTNCSTSGSYTTTNSYLGGFVGGSYAGNYTYTKCFSNMNVSCVYAGGGFAGQIYDSNSTYTNCYATGNVSASSQFAGGFFGQNYSGSPQLTNCYAYGAVTGPSSGGFGGTTTNTILLSNCFWDTQTTTKSNAFGSGSPTGVTGQTTANMNTQSTFTNAGWDFTNIWAIDPGENNGYPTLQFPTVTMAPLFASCPTWMGTNSTDWNTASNWSNNAVPASGANININAAAVNDLVLDQNRSIGILTFNGANRKVVLGNHQLTLVQVGNANATNYVQTNGTGKLKTAIASAATFEFPVGKGYYNPLSITNNTGSADDFSVNLTDSILDAGTTGSSIPNPSVNSTWNVTKTNANGGSGVDLVFSWGDKHI